MRSSKVHAIYLRTYTHSENKLLSGRDSEDCVRVLQRVQNGGQRSFRVGRSRKETVSERGPVLDEQKMRCSSERRS